MATNINAKLVAKNDTRLALSPSFRKILFESPLQRKERFATLSPPWSESFTHNALHRVRSPDASIFRAVGRLVVRALDSRPEGLGGVAIYRPLGEFRQANSYSPVWCSRPRPTTGVLIAHCHDEFRGPRSDYVRQVRAPFVELSCPLGGAPQFENRWGKAMSSVYYCTFVSELFNLGRVGKDIDKVERHMADKAFSHTSKSSATYLARKKSETEIKCIPLDKTPLKSPDASPMEFRAFGLLKQTPGKWHPRTLNRLVKTVQEDWNAPSLVLWEEFVAVDDDNVYTAPNMTHKDILKFVQSSKSIIDTDSEDENEMNNAAPVPMSFKMRNILKSRRNYLDTHSNYEVNKKMDKIAQFVHNLMLKRTTHRKISDYFPK
ncbi:DDE-1 domain-containing protein [Trichonephila clavipes]|nr:DDE-1 domain-containing protein [Trichonephila clavipes]